MTTVFPRYSFESSDAKGFWFAIFVMKFRGKLTTFPDFLRRDHSGAVATILEHVRVSVRYNVWPLPSNFSPLDSQCGNSEQVRFAAGAVFTSLFVRALGHARVEFRIFVMKFNGKLTTLPGLLRRDHSEACSGPCSL